MPNYRIVKCLNKTSSFKVGDCLETVRLGEGTDPDIAVFCSKHQDYVEFLQAYHKRELKRITEAIEYKGSLNSAGWFDRVVERIKVIHQGAKDKELFLEAVNDFEKQLNLVKKYLAQWIAKGLARG